MANWERSQARPYLYAGEGKGADIAAWKQAARAEAAGAYSLEYGQLLLDLVKAFDRIPHRVLVREAKALGYPLWVLKLSLSTYRLNRVIRVGQNLSRVVVATRGITAGSGFATSEMRVMMIRIVDAACRRYRTVMPTLYIC